MTHSERLNGNTKRILKSDRILLDETRVEVGPRKEENSEENKTESVADVTPRKGVDGRIEAIDVTCSCGRNIHLTCEYMEVDKDATRDT